MSLNQSLHITLPIFESLSRPGCPPTARRKLPIRGTVGLGRGGYDADVAVKDIREQIVLYIYAQTRKTQ